MVTYSAPHSLFGFVSSEISLGTFNAVNLVEEIKKIIATDPVAFDLTLSSQDIAFLLDVIVVLHKSIHPSSVECQRTETQETIIRTRLDAIRNTQTIPKYFFYQPLKHLISFQDVLQYCHPSHRPSRAGSLAELLDENQLSLRFTSLSLPESWYRVLKLNAFSNISILI